MYMALSQHQLQGTSYHEVSTSQLHVQADLVPRRDDRLLLLGGSRHGARGQQEGGGEAPVEGDEDNDVDNDDDDEDNDDDDK